MSVRTFLPVVILLVMTYLCACGSTVRDTTRVDGPTAPSLSVLPGLPMESVPSPVRMGSALSSVLINGDLWYQASSGVQAQNSHALFNPPAGTLDWAIYQLPGIDANYIPLSLSTTAGAGQGQHYLALANYQSGRWELLPGKFSTGTTYNYGSNWQDYVSPQGNLYCSVLSHGESVELLFLQFSVDDNNPPATPQNLAAIPGELSASLSWDEVQDPRVTELRIYHSLDPGMAGATLMGTVGASQTETVYGSLDHNVVHYFTIRSYSAALSLESADSNIASCQPDGPVAGTFLPPTNLVANPGPGSADLSWDLYPDPRASHIRVYRSRNADMSLALLVDEIAPTEVAYSVTGLEGGLTYYFALSAWWDAALLESELSNIVDCVPGAAPFELMDGIWPRYGGDMTSSGYSPYAGPADLRTQTSVSLTDSAGRQCRTSPVIDNSGRVYAVSSDAQLSCYNVDLTTRHWRTDANTALSDLPGAFPLAVFSQAPLLDSQGNIYFVATEDNDSLSGNGWALSFDKDGAYRWKRDLGTLPLDHDIPVADMNISPDGSLLCYVDDSSALYALDRDGNLLWDNIDNSNLSRHFYTDIAMDASGQIGQPSYLTDIWIDPRPHWLSFSSTDGSLLRQFAALGSSEHIFGGIFMPNGYFYFPSGAAMLGIDPADGSQIDSNTLLVNAVGAPARDGAGKYMFFAEDQGGGFSGFASFHCVSFTDEAVPQMQTEYGVSLKLETASGKPAIDAEYTAYFADSTGKFHRIAWDPALPLGDGNPVHSSVDLSGSFVYSSAALTDGAAYVISQNNTLFMIGTPVER